MLYSTSYIVQQSYLDQSYFIELIEVKKGLNIYLNRYSNMGARLWNALLPKVNTNVSLPKFKSLLKQFLLSNTIEIQYPK